MSLTQQQRLIIKSTVPVLEAHGETITRLFYKNLLTAVPELNSTFNQGKQITGHQAQALAGALHAYADNIDNVDVLLPAVERISQKHASLHVTPEQYDAVGKYLLEAMAECLGDALTSDILDAWEAAYWQLARLLINKEKDILNSWGEWKDWRKFEIVKKEKESDEVTSFYLKPIDGDSLPAYEPGKFLSIRTEIPALKHLQARQYSLSDASRRDVYRISVKREAGIDMTDPKAPCHPGYVSNVLHDHKVEGDVLDVSHPAGDFFFGSKIAGQQSPVVLISTGVGITPVLAILNTIVESKIERKVSWIHGARNANVDSFREHIASVTRKHNNVSAVTFHSMPLETERLGVDYEIEGRVNLAKLKSDENLALLDTSAHYYICGPDAFMSAAEEFLISSQVDESRIHLEAFGAGLVHRA